MVLFLPIVSLRHSGSTSLSSSLSLNTDLKWLSLLRCEGGRLLGLLNGELSHSLATGSSSAQGPGETAATIPTGSGLSVSTAGCSTSWVEPLLLGSGVVSDGTGLTLPTSPVGSSLEVATELADLSDLLEIKELFLDFTGVSKSSKSSQSSIGNPRDVSRFDGALCELAAGCCLPSPFGGGAVDLVAETANGFCLVGAHFSFWLTVPDLPFGFIGKKVLFV